MLANNQIKFNPTHFMLFILLSTSSFLYESLKPFQPFFYFYIFVLVYFIFYILVKKHIYISKSQIMCLVCIAYWLFVMFLQGQFLLANMNVAMTLSYYFIATNLMYKINKQEAINISKYFILVSLLYITVETIVRINSPVNILAFSSYVFYDFKDNSFMCLDSNFVGIITTILCIFSLYMYYFIKRSKLYLCFMLYAFGLTFLTFSRASLLSLILGFLLFYIYYFLKKHIYFYLIKNSKLTLKMLIFFTIVPIILLFVFIKIILALLSDGSFLTKLDLLDETIDYIKIIPLNNLLWGIGNKIEIITKFFDRATHNFISTYLVSYGIFGFVAIIVYWISIIKDTCLRSIIIFIAIIINGFSLTFPSCPPFYVALSFIYYFEYILPRQERSISAISLNSSANL